jgi:hypothetical protein
VEGFECTVRGKRKKMVKIEFKCEAEGEVHGSVVPSFDEAEGTIALRS